MTKSRGRREGRAEGAICPCPQGPILFGGPCKDSAEKISILSVIGGSSISVLSLGLVARRTKGAVAPGGTFFGGAELWDSNTSQGSKVLSECRKCHFRNPNFKTFQGQHALGPPRLTRLTVCTYTPWGWAAF